MSLEAFWFDEIVTVSFQWLYAHYVELAATITGLIYLIYSIKGKYLLWIFGLISSALYVQVCYQSKIYADMSINIYYVGVSIYGLVHWRKRETSQKVLRITKTTRAEWSLLAIATGVLYMIISFVLSHYTNSDIVYLDALITASSITATWMLARKMLGNWLVWIVIDAISVALFIKKGLYPTVVLFSVYTSLAFLGYIEWKKQWKLQEKG